jgi:hypothetical protein
VPQRGKCRPKRQARPDVIGVVHEFVNGLEAPVKPPKLSDEEKRRIVRLAVFCVRCRSTVGWDGVHGDEIVNLRQPERSPRLSRSCQALLHGLRLLGLTDSECWRVVRQTALGSIPSRKRRVLQALLNATLPQRTSTVAARTRVPETSVKRDLEQLCAFDVLEQHGDFPITWTISNQYREWWEKLTATWGVVDLETLCEPKAEIPEIGRPIHEKAPQLRTENIGDLVGDF